MLTLKRYEKAKILNDADRLIDEVLGLVHRKMRCKQCDNAKKNFMMSSVSSSFKYHFHCTICKNKNYEQKKT